MFAILLKKEEPKKRKKESPSDTHELGEPPIGDEKKKRANKPRSPKSCTGTGISSVVSFTRIYPFLLLLFK